MSLNTWSLNVSLHNNKLTQANTAFSSYFETGLFRELWCERAWLWGTWVSLCCLEVLQTVNDTDLSVSMFVCNTAQGLHAERIHPVLLIQDWYQHWDQYYNTQSHVSTWCSLKSNQMSLYEEAGSQEVHRNSAAASSAHMETLMIHFCGVFTETRHKISSTCFVSFEFLVFILDSCVAVFTHSRYFLVASLMTTWSFLKLGLKTLHYSKLSNTGLCAAIWWTNMWSAAWSYKWNCFSYVYI